MEGIFKILGTGGSMGIPVIGCTCSVCLSNDPKDQRTRSGCLVSYQGKKILIDASQDYRSQALKYQINDLDGVIFTHGHHDHTAGIDDLRVYKKQIPCLLSKETYEDLNVRYHYIFSPKKGSKSLVARLDPQLLEGDCGFTEFCGLPIKYHSFYQVGMKVNGFRLGNLAYVSDIKEYKEDLFEKLHGVDTLILSALRYGPSIFHLSIDEAVAFSRKIQPKETWLTHIAHELETKSTEEYLPSDIRLAYDGLELKFSV